MNTKFKNIIVLLSIFFSLLIAVPVMGHGDDPEEEETSAEVSDSHSDEEDEHASEGDGHGSDTSNAIFIIGGIIGAALLATGAAFLFTPRPGYMILTGLALIGATGVIHLMVGAIWGDILLLLNGLGYFVLGVAWAMPNQFIPNQKRISAIILTIYTLITILGYFLTHDHYDFVAIITKAIEIPLLAILAMSAYQPSTEL